VNTRRAAREIHLEQHHAFGRMSTPAASRAAQGRPALSLDSLFSE
jgi:hypothetical protein